MPSSAREHNPLTDQALEDVIKSVQQKYASLGIGTTTVEKTVTIAVTTTIPSRDCEQQRRLYDLEAELISQFPGVNFDFQVRW